MVLREGDAVRGERAVQRYREADADREAGVDERDRCRLPPAGEEERAGAEEGRGQQGAGRVVDAEGAAVPAVGLSPRDRARGDRVCGEAGRPREELRTPLRAPAARKEAREAEGEKRGGEGDERVHFRRG